jgi:hypothetical protein
MLDGVRRRFIHGVGSTKRKTTATASSTSEAQHDPRHNLPGEIDSWFKTTYRNGT